MPPSFRASPFRYVFALFRVAPWRAAVRPLGACRTAPRHLPPRCIAGHPRFSWGDIRALFPRKFLVVPA